MNIWRRSYKVSHKVYSSSKEVRKRLRAKKKRVKRILLKGVTGKEKWTIERLKTITYDILDRLLVEDYSNFDHMDAALLFLNDLDRERKKLGKLYKGSQKPYSKKIREQLKSLKSKAKMNQVKGNLYLPSKVRTKLENDNIMPLIRYLENKLRARHFLYYGISGIYLVRKFVLATNHSHSLWMGKKMQKAEKENEKYKERLQVLRYRISREEQLLARLIKVEKQREKDTFSIKREGENDWDEIEF